MPSAHFVTTIDLSLQDSLRTELTAQGFTFSTPPYTHFAAKKPGVTCVLYTSGKLVVQGKEMQSFIEFSLEPLLGDFTYTHPQLSAPVEYQPHIGIDESGKGDFFGPLCVAGVYADAKGFEKLKAIGVRDSKNLSDAAILKLAKVIRKECVHHIVKINPAKYNELYQQFRNLNTLLGWGHATVIEQLIQRTSCSDVIIDQFANERVVLTAIRRKNLKLNLTQRHRAEEDLVVAAASILARETFLLGLEKMAQEFRTSFPKGASKATIQAGRDFVHSYGKEALKNVSKLHFKTAQQL